MTQGAGPQSLPSCHTCVTRLINLLQGLPGATGEKGDVGERGEKVDVQQGGVSGLVSVDGTIGLARIRLDQSPSGTRGGPEGDPLVLNPGLI